MEAPAATPALAEARETVVALTRQAGKIQQDCGLDILPDEFVRSVLKWGLVEVCAALRQIGRLMDATAARCCCSTLVLHVCLDVVNTIPWCCIHAKVLSINVFRRLDRAPVNVASFFLLCPDMVFGNVLSMCYHCTPCCRDMRDTADIAPVIATIDHEVQQ